MVGVDSGLDRMLEAGLPIDLAVGDFDSIDPAHVGLGAKLAPGIVVELPADKNVTDLAFAVDYVYNHVRLRFRSSSTAASAAASTISSPTST
ncbi:MAG: hypothetical protein MZU97_09680 [Bacillus subtilis]|nr:hypothetical protein [Bacillus subtilis]